MERETAAAPGVFGRALSLAGRAVQPFERAARRVLGPDGDLKILAVVGAVVLFLLARPAAIGIKRTFPVPVRVHPVGNHVTAVAVSPSTVDVTLRGPAESFTAFNPNGLLVELFPAPEKGALSDVLAVGPKNVRNDLDQLRVESVSPSRIEVEYDFMSEWTTTNLVATPRRIGVPVQGSATVTLPTNFAVKLYGSVKKLGAFTAKNIRLPTDPVDVNGKTESFDTVVAIRPPEDSGITSVEPAEVPVHVEIRTRAAEDAEQIHVSDPVLLVSESADSARAVPKKPEASAGPAKPNAPAEQPEAPAERPEASAVAPAEPEAQEGPAVLVAEWKGGARGAISLYYDDGTESSFRNVVPELVRRGLPGTFYLCGGWFGGEEDPKLVRWGAAAKEHPGIVFLGDHTWAHGGVTNAAQFAEEIARNGALLRRLAGLPEDEPISFALPGAVRWDVTPEEQAKVLADHHEVLRHPFEPNIAGPKDGNNPTFSMRTAPDAAEAFDRAEKRGGWESLIFHGVGGDWIAFDLEEHGKMLDDLAARARDGRLWVGSAIDVHKYATERDAAKLQVLKASEDGYDLLFPGLDFIHAGTGAPGPEYDCPLTIVCDAPAGWTKARVRCERAASATLPEPIEVPVKDGRIVFDMPRDWIGVSVRPVR